MYKQEKYVNKKLDPQKKKSAKNANTVRSHVAQLMTLIITKFIFPVISFA